MSENVKKKWQFLGMKLFLRIVFLQFFDKIFCDRFRRVRSIQIESDLFSSITVSFSKIVSSCAKFSSCARFLSDRRRPVAFAAVVSRIVVKIILRAVLEKPRTAGTAGARINFQIWSRAHKNFKPRARKNLLKKAPAGARPPAPTGI